MPDQPAGLVGVQAAAEDGVYGAPLVLAQNGFPGLAVLHVEQDPVLQRAQEIGALEERLHREAVALLRHLLPTRHVAPVDVPGHAVPVIEQVGHIEELRRGQ